MSAARARRWLPAVVAGACGLLLALLLYRLVFEGRAHSFDSMLYVRSLWGVAHGDLFNPVVGRSSLAIHLHLVLFALAPFARLLGAPLTLVIGQSLALVASVYLVSSAVVRAHSPDSRWSIAASVWVVALTFGATPLVINPFLFDVRPALIGVPFIVAGLMRAMERDGFDGRAIAWMLPALAVREEFGLVLAAALILSPKSDGGSRWQRAASWGGAALCGAYWLFVSAGTGDSASGQSLAMHGGTAFELWGLLGHKALLVVLVLAAAGGLALVGWRWLGSAVPGLLGLLGSTWMVSDQINQHYGLFAAPGILVAAVAGYRRWLRRGAPRARVWVPIWTAVALASFVVASSLPGGGRFQASRFDMRDHDGAVSLDLTRHSAELMESHRLMSTRVPPDAGLAAPWTLAAPVAGRSLIVPIIALDKGARGTDPWIEGVSWVAVPRPRWATLGRYLVRARGFQCVGGDAGLALLTTEGGATKDLAGLPLGAAPDVTSGVVGGWDSVGLSVYGARRRSDGALVVTVARGAGPPDVPPLSLWLHVPGSAGPQPLWIADGVLVPTHLPEGIVVVALSEGPVTGTQGSVSLVDRQGRALVPSSGAAGGGEGVMLRW